VNADEIRDQYIEVLARRMAECDFGKAASANTWREFGALAEDLAEALDTAGLLPTAYIESRGGYEAVNLLGEIIHRVPEEQRWMTEWREVES
jgi:hypothetical protein